MTVTPLSSELPREVFFEIVEETRANFIRKYQALSEAIAVPKILLFVGPHPPLSDVEVSDAWTPHDLIGVHPHLVNQRTIERIKPFFNAYVEVTENEGTTSRLLNRFTGSYCEIQRSETYTVRTHSAYISPRLHAMAALKLFEPTRHLLGLT